LVSNFFCTWKKIEVIISANPKTLDLKKLKLSIEDGLKQYDIEPHYADNGIFISKNFNSKDVILWVLYPKDVTSFWTKGFILSDSKASIQFINVDSSGNPISNYMVKNAIEYDKLEGYAALEKLIL
jgi:hypothetical protein